MKKVLIISSSPRIDGDSAALCNEFYNGAKENGNKVKIIYLSEYNINHCMGCCSCFKGLECPQIHKDDADSIIQQMIDADVVVLATPVYFYDVSSQLKTLIDRCCARRREICGKDFYCIVTMADKDKNNAEHTFKTMEYFINYCPDSTLKAKLCGNQFHRENGVLTSPAIKEAFALGKSVK